MIYINCKARKIKKIVAAGIATASIWMLPSSTEAAPQETKIHFISLNSATDAILLESNGHYGLVDFGEDWDYPDGTDSRYPLRSGITKGVGYEQQVIHYLKSQGVEKLDFCVATHSHSDHIGGGDEILDAFPTDRLYINRYDDSYIVKENEFHLWDNQYIYDDIIDAANRNNTEIITDLDLEENTEYRSFTLGDMSIDLMNLQRRRDKNRQILPVVDENENCIVTKITAYGRTALLTADIDPTEGDTGRLANQLIEELGDLPQYQPENRAEPELKEEYPKENYKAVSATVFDLPENRVVKDTGVFEKIDETQINTGKRIGIDLMKMAHHSNDWNNTTYFLTSLNPKAVVITGYETSFTERERDCLPNSKVYATATDSAAVISEFHDSGIKTRYVKLSPEWMKIDDGWYYFDENGRTFTDESVHEIDGKPYCFDAKGAVEKENRWVKVNGKWKYWLVTGEFQKDSWLKLNDVSYYLDEQGNVVIGWKQIDDSWYYFNEDGTMATDSWIGEDYVDVSGAWKPEILKEKWMSSGGKWWYRHSDGSYTTSNWEWINGKWYYFDASGWMMTGWQKVGNEWYYLYSNGVMAADSWIGENYVDATGIWRPEILKEKWISSGEKWWYRHSDGSYTALNWKKIDGKWYYFDASGWMVTGWQKVGDNWYYLYDDGVMASDTWVGNYYLKSDGTMAVSEWVQDGKYYVDENGLWVA